MRRQWADLQFVPTHCDGKVSALLFKKQLSSISAHDWTDAASSRFNITLSEIFTSPADNPNPDLETLCSIVKDRIKAFRQRGVHLSSCLNSVFQICSCNTDLLKLLVSMCKSDSHPKWKTVLTVKTKHPTHRKVDSDGIQLGYSDLVRAGVSVV
jgi:hypothetical protein